jgi:hypothetical protein
MLCRQWSKQIQGILLTHQDKVVAYIKAGYDEQTVEDRLGAPPFNK